MEFANAIKVYRKSGGSPPLLLLSWQPTLGAPHPRFPVKFRGSCEIHAPFLEERRTRGSIWGCVQEIRGISLVFREMWDTTNSRRSAVG